MGIIFTLLRGYLLARLLSRAPRALRWLFVFRPGTRLWWGALAFAAARSARRALRR